jgi:hypothetical protein
MIVSLYIGEDKLDLFNDETIEINSSVQNVNDITKNTTDFSKNFTIPASEINNKIFKHYYDANIDNGFDARTKVSGRIEIDGVVYRYGKFSLLSVKLKQDKPSSYSIVFYGNLINLVDLLKDDQLNDLDLSAYNHEYNSDNVLTGLQSGLFGGDIAYTLFAKKQYYYNSNPTDNTTTDKLTNIAYNGGSDNGIIWSDLLPSIKLLPIIEAIENKYSISFTRDFFDRDEFKNLYLWVNKDTNPISFEKKVDFNDGTNPYLNFTTDIATYEFEIPNTYYVQTKFKIEPKAGFETVEYTITMYVNDSVYKQKAFTGDSPLFGKDIFKTAGTQTVYFTITTSQHFEFDATYRAIGKGPLGVDIFNYVVYGNDNFINADLKINANLPSIKIIDFLKGLFNMFKLVVIQDNDNDLIYINTLNDYYSNGKLYDITEYVSTSEYEVERGNLLNEILYKFQEPTTITNAQFKLNTGNGYGDEELRLEDDNGKPLDGEKQDYSVPFEQIIYDRLIDQNDGIDTTVMYAAIIDTNTDLANPKPHLHYIVNNTIDSKTISFINDANVEVELNTFVNLPSHTLGFTEPLFSTVFGQEVNEYTREIITNTLYSNYHSDYITSIFNIKRRNFKYESKLPLRILLNLKLNDVLRIKDNYFRINTFTSNLLNGKTKLDLINSFDNTVNPFIASRTEILTDYTAKTESIFVTNLTNYSFTKEYPIGTTPWLPDITNYGGNVYFDIPQSYLFENRTVTVVITNTDTLQEVSILIIQTPDPAGMIYFGEEGILFGNTTITFE